MTTPRPSADDVNGSLRRVRLGVLATLAVCALVASTSGNPAHAGQTDLQGYTWVALALAALCILARGIGITRPDSPERVTWILVSLSAAAAIGLLGVAVAVQHGEQQAGLLYTVGGAILTLRPLPVAVAPRD